MSEAEHSGLWGRLDRVGPIGWLIVFAGALALLWGGFMLMPVLRSAGVPFDAELALVVPPVLAIVTMIVWYNERAWIFTAVLGHISMALSTGHVGFGVGEAIFSAASMGGLMVWFFKEMVIHRRRVVVTGFDALLMGVFWVSTATSILMNIVHEGDGYLFLKDWLIPFDTLLYFPLKKAIRNRNDVLILFRIFTLVAIVSGIAGILTYRARLMQAVFQWQVEASRVFTNEPTAMAFLIFCAAVYAYSRRMKSSVISILGMAAGMAFLTVSFSRGAIASGIIGVVAIVVLAPFKQGRRVVVAGVAALVACGVVVYIAFPGIAANIAKSVEGRVSTVATATSDLSFNLRVNEARVLLTEYVPKSPLLGYGYGTPYKLFDPLSRTNHSFLFIHNGYVRLIYKFGVPLALMFYLLLFYPLIRLIYRRPLRADRFEHGIMIGSASLLIATLVLYYVSDQFSTYAGALNLAICWTMFDYVNRHAVRRERAAKLLYGEGPATPGLLTRG